MATNEIPLAECLPSLLDATETHESLAARFNLVQPGPLSLVNVQGEMACNLIVDIDRLEIHAEHAADSLP
jgi:hypothetical protein